VDNREHAAHVTSVVFAESASPVRATASDGGDDDLRRRVVRSAVSATTSIDYAPVFLRTDDNDRMRVRAEAR